MGILWNRLRILAVSGYLREITGIGMVALAHISRRKDTEVLAISGAWVADALGDVEQALDAVSVSTGGRLVVDGSGLEALDSSGAWLLVSWVRRHGVDAQPRGFTEEQQDLLALMEKIEHPESMTTASASALTRLVSEIGAHTLELWRGFIDGIAFFGHICMTAGAVMAHPKRWRMQSTVYHIYRHGICAAPIIMLMAFLVSIVTGYQGANQLQKFGADIFTVDLVAISLLREMGVLITAIMVAGRSGSAFAAQIGVMQVNEEVDAMRSLGLDPYELLVLPRVLALVIVLPLLTFIADIVGLAGAWVVSAALLDISWVQFLTRLDMVVSPQVFFIGLSKAPVFGLLIALVGCRRGMLVRASADQVGRQTTLAVVQAIFIVLVFDALFSVFFTTMGW